MTACPNCESMNTYVTNSRPKFRGGRQTVCRRRACKDCKNKFTTYEMDVQHLKEFESYNYTRALRTLEKIKKIIGSA